MKSLFPCRAIAAAFSFAFITPVLSQTVSDDEQLNAFEARVQQLESVSPPQAAPASAGAFNPAISLILSGIYSHLSQDPASYRITNFPVATSVEIGPGMRGFSLAGECALVAQCGGAITSFVSRRPDRARRSAR